MRSGLAMRAAWVLVGATLAWATAASADRRIRPRLVPRIHAVGTWADSAEHPKYSVAQMLFTSLMGQRCTLQHYSVEWTEVGTGVLHSFEGWPEKVTLGPRAQATLEATIEAWDVDRARPPDVQVRGVDCTAE
jgi:hypothetical protein